MGRLEDRVRKLEEANEAAGWDAAISRLGDEDVFTLADWAQRAQQADEAGEPRPYPTPDEAAAAQRFEELRAAVREGWGKDAYRII